MHALYQRLRELDWDTFQRLAFQLLSEKHPGLAIKHVDGSGGDKGLDLFEGPLAAKPTIWQCKHFPNGLKSSQRSQVTESLKEAVKHFKPNNWILVISVDLDAKGFEWFQKLQKSYSEKTKIGLFQASDIVRELIHRRNIRDTFFPNAVLDTIVVRRSLERLGEMDDKSLDALGDKGLDEQIARLEEADARFNYGISYGPNAGLDVANAKPISSLHIASVSMGAKRTDIFVRDPDAVLLDPPKINFSVNRAGMEKLLEFQRTGKPQQLTPEEVTVPKSTFDFVLPAASATAWQLHILPTAEQGNRVLSWRVKATNGDQEIQYDFVKFRIVAVGTDQAELESTSDLPFLFGLRMALTGLNGSTFTFTERFGNHRLLAVAKALKFKKMLKEGGRVELHSLDQDLPLGTMSSENSGTLGIDDADRAVIDMAEVATAFGWDVPWPRRISRDDLLQLALLLSIVRGTPLPLDSVETTIRKTPATVALMKELGFSQVAIYACVRALIKPLVFCGTMVETGPILLQSSEAQIDNPSKVLSALESAGDEEDSPIKFRVGVIYGERSPHCDGRLYIAPVA
jgi:hypothetical protein